MIGLKIVLGTLSALIVLLSILCGYYAYKRQITDSKICFFGAVIAWVVFVMFAILTQQLNPQLNV